MFDDQLSHFFAVVNAQCVAGGEGPGFTQVPEFSTRATVQNKEMTLFPRLTDV
jgi:hypothetical protein